MRSFILESPRLGSIERQILYNGRYDLTYGIHDNRQEHPDLPMPEVALHWAEDTSVDSPLYESTDEFVKADVFKYSGMNYSEYMMLPRDIRESLLEACLKKQSSVGEAEDALSRKLQDMGK